MVLRETGGSHGNNTSTTFVNARIFLVRDEVETKHSETSEGVRSNFLSGISALGCTWQKYGIESMQFMQDHVQSIKVYIHRIIGDTLQSHCFGSKP